MSRGIDEPRTEEIDHATTSRVDHQDSAADQNVGEVLFARLLQEFPTPAAIVELTAIVAFENFRSKFNHTLDIGSNGFCVVEHAGGTNEARGTGP